MASGEVTLVPIDAATSWELPPYAEEEFTVISPSLSSANANSDDIRTPRTASPATTSSALAPDKDRDIIIAALPPLVNNAIVDPVELLSSASQSAYSSRASARYSRVLNSNNDKGED
jgi:hypothetical protein